MDETPIYQETQRMPFGYALVLISGLAVFAAVYFTVKEWWGLYLALGVAVLDWILLSLTTRLDIVVTPTRLTFGLPIFKKNFALTALEVGGIEKISWLAGIGIHRWRSHWVFNAHFGRGVRLKAGRTYYLLGSEQPERLLAALQQAVPTRRVT